MSASLPYSYPVDLTSVSQQGTELHLSPDATERGRIAAWLGALEVPALGTTIRLAQLGSDDYSYHAEFSAEIVQACVVTLEPVRSLHSGTFSRRYRVMGKPASRRSLRTLGAEPGNEEKDEDSEVVASPVIDLAAPLLEELSLVLDPYPRAPGVRFEPPKEESQGTDSPFAVLAKLKQSQKREPEPRN
jgi:uncharacterized metal-binding protein YceD (DUF177 family)